MLYSRENKHYTNTSNKTIVNLNHIGIQVDDIDIIEKRVKAKLATFNYEPRRRFYFNFDEKLEIEVLSYHEWLMNNR